MVLPAVFGCDTTSSFYSHLLLQTLVPGKWASLRREMDVFKDPGSTHEQIHEADIWWYFATHINHMIAISCAICVNVNFKLVLLQLLKRLEKSNVGNW